MDAIVTDPPYGLAFMGSKWDNFGANCGNDSTVAFQTAMQPIFAEALRVAKPGAHLLAFGGSRTYHRLACAIEDAGWEVRDCIMWVYGSGFPKSMDVAKAIDKASGYEGEVIGSRIVDVGMQGGNMHAGRMQQQQQQQIRALSPEAAVWEGWGTCLKPAYEPIIVARKPLDGTVAANVLKYGAGAINIDGCRVPTNDKLGGGLKAGAAQKGWDRPFMHDPEKQAAFVERKKANVEKSEALGRFPANLIHDGSDEVLTLFPDSKGQCGAVTSTEPSRTGSNGIYGNYNGQNTMCPRGDTGSAARFFYCAKASSKERGKGNVHPTVKPIALMEYLIKLVAPKGATVLDPFMGSGTTGVAAVNLGNRFVGIEKESEYASIASTRIDKAVNEKKQMLDI